MVVRFYVPASKSPWSRWGMRSALCVLPSAALPSSWRACSYTHRSPLMEAQRSSELGQAEALEVQRAWGRKVTRSTVHSPKSMCQRGSLQRQGWVSPAGKTTCTFQNEEGASAEPGPQHGHPGCLSPPGRWQFCLPSVTWTVQWLPPHRPRPDWSVSLPHF